VGEGLGRVVLEVGQRPVADCVRDLVAVGVNRRDRQVVLAEQRERLLRAIVVGDVATQRMAIEEGAYLKGKVDMQKQSSAAKAGSE